MSNLRPIDWPLLMRWLLADGVWMLLALLVGLATFLLLRRWVPRAVAGAVRRAGPLQETLERASGPLAQALVGIGTVIITLAVLAVILARLGIDIGPAGEVARGGALGLGRWLLSHGLPILIILLLSYLAYRATNAVGPRATKRLVALAGEGRRSEEELAKRSQTLSGVLTTTAAVAITMLALFMILSELGVDITPLLAGAGVAGIAVGFGAQNLIRDVLSGLFIVLEDQYGKGDVVRVADVAGLVEEVNLRRTILRDLDGIVHSIPNGEIRVASNFTRDWSRVNLNIPVAYGEDLDKVIEVLNRVGRELAEDDSFGPLIINAPHVLRVDNFGDSAIEIKMLGETKPIRQWDVMGELRKRVKKAFDEEGIEIPWPHIKLYFGSQPPQATADLLALVPTLLQGKAGADLTAQGDTIPAQGPTCEACSQVNAAGSRFCSHCGAPLTPPPQREA